MLILGGDLIKWYYSRSKIRGYRNENQNIPDKTSSTTEKVSIILSLYLYMHKNIIDV